jgi:hypothetical protein
LGYYTEIWCASFTSDPFDLKVLTIQQPPSKMWLSLPCRILGGVKATFFFFFFFFLFCFGVKTAILVPFERLGTFYDSLSTVFLYILHCNFLLGQLWENPSLFF